LTEPNSTTPIKEHTGAKMCRAGVATDTPCWRPATETDLGEREPTLCTLHVELRNRAANMDGWLHSLKTMRSLLKSKAAQEHPHSVLLDGRQQFDGAPLLPPRRRDGARTRSCRQ
jgi:hypothetical protein